MVFEVANKATWINVKLMICDLDEKFQARDAHWGKRMQLVQAIGASQRTDIFGSAFYKGEPPRPRTPTPQYFSVLNRSFTIEKEEPWEGQLRSRLGLIRDEVIPVLEGLMNQVSAP